MCITQAVLGYSLVALWSCTIRLRSTWVAHLLLVPSLTYQANDELTIAGPLADKSP